MRISNRLYSEPRAIVAAVAIALIAGACVPQERVTLSNPVIIGRSVDERHVAWAQKNAAGKAVVSVDGEVRFGEHDEIGAITFGPDARRIAYSVRDGDAWRMMIDAEPGPEFDEIGIVDIAFSPDGARFAYGARRGGKWLVIADGAPVVPEGHDAVRDLAFSPDGRLVYRAVRNDRQAIVINGVPGPSYDRVKRPVWSPDGKRFAYAAQAGGRTFIVLDGREGPRYDDITSPAFSFDGRRFAYGARKNGKSLVVADGREGPAYEMDTPIDPVKFAPADGRLGYAAKKSGPDGGWVVVVDGLETPPFPYIDGAGIAFNPGDSSFAFTAASGPNELMMVSVYGVSEGYDGIAGPVFSRDGSRIAYAAKKGNRLFLFVDGPAGVEIEADDVSGLSFSPDGKHLLYKAKANGLEHLVLDDRQGPAYDRIYKPAFTERGVEYLADRESDGWMWRGLIPYASGEERDPSAEKPLETKLGWLPTKESLEAPCALCEKQKELLGEEGR